MRVVAAPRCHAADRARGRAHSQPRSCAARLGGTASREGAADRSPVPSRTGLSDGSEDTHAPPIAWGTRWSLGTGRTPLNWPSNGHQLTERRALGKGTPESPPLHKETYSVGLFFHRASAAFRARAVRCAGLSPFHRTWTAFRAAALRSWAVRRFARVFPPCAPHARNRTFARSSDSWGSRASRAGLTRGFPRSLPVIGLTDPY